MRNRIPTYRWFWSLMILGAVLMFSRSLWAADWEKLTWDGTPKDKKGNPQNAGTVAIVGKNNVYFTYSDSHLVHWDGKSFKEIKHENTGDKNFDIRNLVVNSEKDIWAFGDNGLSLHYDGNKWASVKNPMTGKGRREGRLWGSGCVTPKKCFAGTRAGDLIEWDGSSWKLASKAGEPPAEGSRIYAIEFISKNNGWMAGEALMAKWDGEGWKKQKIEVPRIYDLALVGSDFGWAVGDGGAFFKFDGKTWTKVNVKGSFFRMRSVSCSSKDNCWAVGDAGAAFKWDGKDWIKVKLGTFDRLSRVRIAHGQGFIVGQKGIILKVAHGAPKPPLFPWPPPRASASEVIPPNFFKRNTDERLKVGDVEKQLREALNSTGYFERSYYAVPNGFAVVTRLEQINLDGTPKKGSERWATDVKPLRKFSLRAYLRALFFASPGYYRIIVFIFTPYAFSQENVMVDTKQAVTWVSAGLNKLPKSIGEEEYSQNHTCTALIYEFEQHRPGQVKHKMPGRLAAKTHLEKAELWNALEE